jgi:hypothetical protein
VRAAKTGKLNSVGPHQKPLTEIETELGRVKRLSGASAWIAIAFPPLSSISLTTAEAALASFAYVKATLAPSAARRCTIAAPMPREPPVTSATF